MIFSSKYFMMQERLKELGYPNEVIENYHMPLRRHLIKLEILGQDREIIDAAIHAFLKTVYLP
jgi:hypothetical protein